MDLPSITVMIAALILWRRFHRVLNVKMKSYAEVTRLRRGA